MGSEVNITLTEHCCGKLPPDFPVGQFIGYMDEVWANRLLFAVEDFGEAPIVFEPSRKQPFFNFTYLREIKARNYIGFVNWEDHLIEVVPKVFDSPGPDKINIWNHLVYWLSYCRRIVFPFSSVNAWPDASNSLPEALIYAFARFTNDILIQSPYSCYEEIVESGQILKGRFNVHSYLNEQYTKGNPHVMVMDHEPFMYDNLLNRILKYVAVSLHPVSRSAETFYELQRIRFLLDEVTDGRYIATDCDRVKLNRLHAGYGTILDMCRFFLSESYLSREAGNLQNLSFLIPMDYVFEDFIAGFLTRHFGDRYQVDYQAHNWLTDQKVFQIRHDLILTNRETHAKLIIDTKYKLRDRNKDSKKGISQTDLYQMVSYALRANCNTVLLLYPYHAGSSLEPDQFTVSSKMIPGKNIRIFAADVPMVFDDLNGADMELRERLEGILSLIINQ